MVLFFSASVCCYPQPRELEATIIRGLEKWLVSSGDRGGRLATDLLIDVLTFGYLESVFLQHPTSPLFFYLTDNHESHLDHDVPDVPQFPHFENASTDTSAQLNVIPPHIAEYDDVENAPPRRMDSWDVYKTFAPSSSSSSGGVAAKLSFT